ncbi:hypothetical protein PTI98_002137 [Pleurotus ostreatus]|nr:hypothetical protein PTI98_002137 [Pleurotus ostreatus]
MLICSMRRPRGRRSRRIGAAVDAARTWNHVWWNHFWGFPVLVLHHSNGQVLQKRARAQERKERWVVVHDVEMEPAYSADRAAIGAFVQAFAITIPEYLEDGIKRWSGERLDVLLLHLPSLRTTSASANGRSPA